MELPLATALVSLFLVGLFYAAIKVKGEHHHYLKHAEVHSLGNYQLRVPAWWQAFSKTDNSVSFKRRETYYDWQAHFETFPERGTAKVFIEERLTELELVLDPGDGEIHAAGALPYRLEGQGTLAGEKRVYFDAAFIPGESGPGLWAYSLSSILNGSLEGPYFEAVLKHLSRPIPTEIDQP